MSNYHSFSASVQGASHVKKKIVMQDASGNFEDEKVKLIALSDGHGDSSCFRSDRGSRLIVDVGIAELKAFAEEMDGKECELDDEKSREIRVRQLIRRILANWNIEVEKDLENNPVSEEEYKVCSNETIRQAYKNGIKQNGIYGATFIAVLLTNTYVLALHQGDGRCLMIDRNGAVTYPIPWDERCQGRNTTSVCNSDAAESTRYYYVRLNEQNRPAAFFVASDGIEDSYRTLELSQCFYKDLCEKLVMEGKEETTKWLLNEQLYKVSSIGSGDDMSVAGVFDIEALKALIPTMQKKYDQLAWEEKARNAKEHLDSMQGKRKYLKKKYEEALTREEKANSVQTDETKLEAEKARKVALYEELEKAASQIHLLEETLQKLRAHKVKYEKIEAEYKECEQTLHAMEEFGDSRKRFTQELQQISKEYQEYEERYQRYLNAYDTAMAEADRLRNEQNLFKDKEVNKEADADVTDESAAAKEEKLEKMTVSLEKIEELEDQKNVSDDKNAFDPMTDEEEKAIALQKMAIDDYIKDTQM